MKRSLLAGALMLAALACTADDTQAYNATIVSTYHQAGPNGLYGHADSFSAAVTDESGEEHTIQLSADEWRDLRTGDAVRVCPNGWICR